MGKKVNLKWQQETLRAKAGLSSRMAVPKKIAQKARAKLKKQANGTEIRFGPDDALQSKLFSISLERAKRQRHHLVKQLQQAAKKAKTFLIRRMLRQTQEASGTSAVAQAGGSEKLLALRSVAPAAVVRRALLPLGLIDEIALLDKEIAEHEEHAEADGDDDHSNTQNAAEDSAGIDAANQPSTDLRAQMESRLLGTPAVQQQLDKIRAHEDKLEQQQQQQQRKLQQGTQGADADKNHDTESGAPSKKRQRGERKKKAKAEEEEEEEEGGTNRAKKAKRTAARSNASGSQFMDSLMGADSDDGGGGSDDGSDGETWRGTGGVMATSRDGGMSSKSRAPSGKAKNVISRSGNRMGQRQRQRLLEQKQGIVGKGSGKGGDGGGGGGKGGRKSGGKGGGKGGGRVGSGGGSGGGWGGSAGRINASAENTGHGNGTGGNAKDEKLHPSWEAKKTPEGAIQAFAGKRMVFD